MTQEWAITKCTFGKITDELGYPEVDLFASRTNHKVERFVSWYPDPESIAVDAFSLYWGTYDLSYCFPPFSVIGQVLKKLREEQATAIMVAPMWNTQSWYPTLVKMIVDFPLVFPATRANLFLPHRPSEVHPLKGKLSLMAVKVSGKSWEALDFRRKLRT